MLQSVHTCFDVYVRQGAIKFGEQLSRSDCQQLIRKLSLCRLPFQCAHGRPSVTPILDLQQFISDFAYVVSGHLGLHIVI